MALNAETVRSIASLARLDLHDDEVDRLTGELEQIVAYVEQLQEVDVEGVEPVCNVTGLEMVTREDVPGPMLPVETALANAPQANAEAFLVPKAVER